MKNNADLGRCFQPRPSASVGNTLCDPHNSSYPTQPHSIIANYVFSFAMELKKLLVSGKITASCRTARALFWEITVRPCYGLKLLSVRSVVHTANLD